jgi:hypothetical protein
MLKRLERYVMERDAQITSAGLVELHKETIYLCERYGILRTQSGYRLR